MDVICLIRPDSLDGFGAAWVLNKALWETGDFLRVREVESEKKPGKQPVLSVPSIPRGSHVVIAGLCYPPSVLDSIADTAESVLVVERHRKAIDPLFSVPHAPITLAEYRAELEERSKRAKLLKRLDLTRSTSASMWDFCFPGTPLPWLLQHVQDYHLRQFKLPGTHHVMRALRTYAREFATWDEIIYAGGLDEDDGAPPIVREGKAIARAMRQDTEFALKDLVRFMVIGGHIVPVANLPHFMANEAADILSTGTAPFVATYQDGRVDGQLCRRFSLRSRARPDGDDFDVAAIARKYGGGGSSLSAGFTVPLGWEGDRATADDAEAA